MLLSLGDFCFCIALAQKQERGHGEVGTGGRAAQQAQTSRGIEAVNYYFAVVYILHPFALLQATSEALR